MTELAHLDVGPSIAEHHLARLAVDIREGVIYVCEVMVWDHLWGKFAVVDSPSRTSVLVSELARWKIHQLTCGHQHDQLDISTKGRSGRTK